MTEEEKEAIEEAKKQIKEAHNLNELNIFMTDSTTLKILLNYIDKLQEEIEKYKRLAEANLKDVQEFQDNMCNHRCIKNNEVLELKEELEKKDKVIEEIKNKLEEHIKFCKQEAKGHLENNICHISLKFDKSLLEIIEKVVEEDE